MPHPYTLPRRKLAKRPVKEAFGLFAIKRRNRFWEVIDSTGELVCMTVYKRGATEVVRRLSRQERGSARLDSQKAWAR